MTPYAASHVIAAAGWLTIGFTAGMMLIELHARLAGTIVLDLHDARREKSAPAVGFKDAA